MRGTSMFVCPFPTSSSAKVEGVHKEFQRTAKASVCYYDAERGCLVLLSKDEQSQKRAMMVQEMYFRNLSQKVSRSDISCNLYEPRCMVLV